MMLVLKLFETECISSMLPPGFGARTSRKVAGSGKGYARNLVYMGQLTEDFDVGPNILAKLAQKPKVLLCSWD